MRCAAAPWGHAIAPQCGAVPVDTGLGHLCAALDVPTVSLYGPTQVRLVGTCGRNQAHLQSPLGSRAGAAAQMASLAVADVWAALLPLLADGAPRPAHQGSELPPELPDAESTVHL